MRLRTLVFFSYTLAAAAASASPVTLQELDLMIRMQLPEAEVLHDVSQRRLMSAIDAAAKRKLTADGASANLLAKLEAGNFVLPPDQAAAAALLAEEDKARIAREKAADAASIADQQRLRAAASLPPAVPGPAVAGTAPIGQAFDLQFTAVDGRAINIRDLRGKVVLIDFWATWCGPCVQEIPHVKAAYDKLHASGFEVVGLSFDESKVKLERFVAGKGLQWPQYFDGGGWNNKYAHLFGISHIPTMWLVDKQGILRDTNGRDGLENKVAALLAL